jgi:Glycosyl transferase family 2
MPRAPIVTAIIAAYNEEDVIGAVVADLVGQGIRVYLLDHGSTDGTLAEVKRFRRRGLIGVERLDGEDFSLERIIRRKEMLAAELETDWVINADADEFRESPWPGVSLVDALREVDRLGYNAVDFAVVNFMPVHDGFRKGDDPREVFTFYEPGAVYDRLQVRCWKKQPVPLDLVSTAGHEARFEGRRVFPLRFLLRHYPIRGQAHGERKVWRERVPRFAPGEKARGWHVQYDGLQEGCSFLRPPSALIPYDPWAARLELALHHRGVEALEADLTESRTELAAVRDLCARLEGELAAARAAFERERDRAQQARIERDSLRADRDRVARELLQWRGESAHLREELTSTRETAERRMSLLQHRLDAVLGSRIWRWTAPVRALLDAVFRA